MLCICAREFKRKVSWLNFPYHRRKKNQSYNFKQWSHFRAPAWTFVVYSGIRNSSIRHLLVLSDISTTGQGRILIASYCIVWVSLIFLQSDVTCLCTIRVLKLLRQCKAITEEHLISPSPLPLTSFIITLVFLIFHKQKDTVT